MLIGYIKKNIETLHYKKLFLFGAYIGIIIIAFVSSVVDIITQYYTDAIINFTSGIFALLSYLFICKKVTNCHLYILL